MKTPSVPPKVREWLFAAACGLVAVLVVFTLAFQAYNAFETRTIVSGHNSELAQIKTLEQQIAKGQKNHAVTLDQIHALATELKAGNATVSQILIEAGAAVKQLEADQAALCAGLHINCPPTGGSP